jgi:hypothetical protein
VKRKGIIINQIILFVLFIVITFAGCGDQQINSKWRSQNITIDGNDSDWGNSLVFYDDINSLVGVQNDNDYLYLCLVTTDQQLERRILRTGLTIWFDNSGKGDKKFGIRFPLLLKNMGKNAFKSGDDMAEGRRRDSNDGRESLGDNGQPGGILGGLSSGNMSFKNQTEVEVVDSKDEATRAPISELKGIELKMTLKDYRMVYEFKIPTAMKSGFSYAIGANTGSLISVGFETGLVDKRNKAIPPDRTADENGVTASGEGSEGGDDAGAGDMYGGGGRGRGRRGGQGGFTSGSLQTIQFWADIKLSNGSN